MFCRGCQPPSLRRIMFAAAAVSVLPGQLAWQALHDKPR